MKPTDFAYHLTNYLTKHLPGVIGASKNTVLAYRDTFGLILRFARSQEGIREERLSLQAIDKDFVIRFLTWLEGDRCCSVSTRNQRLAAIHAFFTYLQPLRTDMLFQIQDVLAIPMKKHRQAAMQFMSEEGVKALLAEPDISTKAGRKHLIILSFPFILDIPEVLCQQKRIFIIILIIQNLKEMMSVNEGLGEVKLLLAAQ